MTDTKEGTVGLSSTNSTKDTASLLSMEPTGDNDYKRIRGNEFNKTNPGNSVSSLNKSQTHTTAVVGPAPSTDRSKKHLTVTFSTGRRAADGTTTPTIAANNTEKEESAAINFASPSDSLNKRFPMNRRSAATDSSARASFISTTSSNSSSGVSAIPKTSYDNYAGPGPASTPGLATATSTPITVNSGNDLAKFLRDDEIWSDLKVGFSEESNEIFGSDDLLETSASSSIVQGSERSWTPASVRNRVEKIRSKCLPTWANIKTFVSIICILIAVHGALATGYTMSVITTIEKRFEISSRTSGLIVSSYEFGSLLSVIFVSYFGSNGHIPRIVGIGGLILAAGSLLFSLPHVIAPSYVPSNSSGNGAPDTCAAGKVLMPKNLTSVIMEAAKISDSCTDGNENYVLILMLAQTLLGIGGTPLFTLGTTYIDNHVDKDDASFYLAFMYVSMALGPVLGFLLGALMLSEYVNATVPEFLTTNSPEWVGLWWGGFIVCGALYFVSSLPFFLFPRRLTNKRANEEDTEYGRSWKKIPISVLQLLTNSVYMVATFNACIELAIVTGFTVFLPKYLETQFRVSTSNASVLTGAVAVPGACVGIFFGGWIMKRLKLELHGVANLVVLVNFTAMIMMIGFFLFGCGTLNIAGVTTHYQSPFSSNLTDGTPNLTDPCNSQCRCSQAELQMKHICGIDGKTYMSPCFAGCKVSKAATRQKKTLVGEFTKTDYEYFDCQCIVPASSASPVNLDLNLTTTATPPYSSMMARDGMCDDDCNMLVPFMILVFILSLAASNNQMPIVMVTLRSVSTQEKAFALGVQVVILRLLSYIPAPIIYGDVIDNTCVFWNKKCGNNYTNCLVYDIDGFRVRFASLSMGFMVMGVALSLLLVFCIRRRFTPFSPPVTMSEIAHRFGDFDNLHIVRNGKLKSWVSDDSLVNSRPKARHQKTRSC